MIACASGRKGRITKNVGGELVTPARPGRSLAGGTARGCATGTAPPDANPASRQAPLARAGHYPVNVNGDSTWERVGKILSLSDSTGSVTGHGMAISGSSQRMPASSGGEYGASTL